jgi:hypothetical protein
MGDLSNSAGYIPLAVFLDMNKRYIDYNKTHSTKASKIYIEPKRVDFVDSKTFENMQYRYDQYVAKNGKKPSVVYFLPASKRTPVKPSRVVGNIQKQLEEAVGQFNNFTEFYNKSKGRGYAYYFNDVYTLQEEINRYKNKQGLNCSDAAQLFGALAKEMGYEWRYVHVQCSSGGHIRAQIRGKEFSDWTRLDPAACISVGSQYPISRVWCDNNTAYVTTASWILIDDGA